MGTYRVILVLTMIVNVPDLLIECSKVRSIWRLSLLALDDLVSEVDDMLVSRTSKINFKYLIKERL